MTKKEKKKILITGAGGMLGTSLCQMLSPSHYVVGLLHEREVDVLPDTEFATADITQPDEIGKVVQDVAPDIIIHAAAYTDVDGCDLNPEVAFTVNSEGTKNVALACRECAGELVYISTDYVFDGTASTPYPEAHPPTPQTVYGKSKHLGETHVAELLSRWYIVRTSWLFGAGGKNFVDTISKLAQERDELRVVHDQVGCPTFCEDLAQAISKLIQTKHYGIYHITNSGHCSWYQFSQEILRLTKHDDVRIVPIISAELDRPAKRPEYSVLAKTRLTEAVGLEIRSWQLALHSYLTED
jgi:dTDP-4-dehydrorhamnose reductase